MRVRGEKDHPSPVLAGEHVRAILIERNGEVGASGGAVGGSASAWPGTARAGESGGRTGGRLGARLFTRVRGLTHTLAVPCTSEAVARARALLAPVPGAPSPAPSSPLVLIGFVGAGALGMNSAVLQLVWHPHQLDVTAHALEGIVDQRTAAGAIGKLGEVLVPAGR